MSLVITCWDKQVGIAVSEGRAVAYVGGQVIPVLDDSTKLSRLPDGSILGVTGGPRDGCAAPAVTEWRGLVTDPIRQDIHKAGETRTFTEMCGYIPELIAKYRTQYPEWAFGASLIGLDASGCVRGASWSTTSSIDNRDCDLAANVLGLTSEINAEASRAVGRYFAKAARGYIDVAETCKALSGIIKDLSTRCMELNDRVKFEFIFAPGARERLFPVLGANGAILSGVVLENLVDQTINHVGASMSVFPASSLSVSVSDSPVTVATITINSSGPTDFWLLWLLLSGSNGTSVKQIYVDGSPGGAGACSDSNTSGRTSFGLITGLAAGSHTLTVIAAESGSTPDIMAAGCGSMMVVQVSATTGGFNTAPTGGVTLDRPVFH